MRIKFYISELPKSSNMKDDREIYEFNTSKELAQFIKQYPEKIDMNYHYCLQQENDNGSKRTVLAAANLLEPFIKAAKVLENEYR